jgi:hypothetical protein
MGDVSSESVVYIHDGIIACIADVVSTWSLFCYTIVLWLVGITWVEVVVSVGNRTPHVWNSWWDGLCHIVIYRSIDIRFIANNEIIEHCTATKKTKNQKGTIANILPPRIR